VTRKIKCRIETWILVNFIKQFYFYAQIWKVVVEKMNDEIKFYHGDGPCPEGYVRYGEHLPKGNSDPVGLTEARRQSGFSFKKVYDHGIPDILDMPVAPDIPTAGHPSQVDNTLDSGLYHL